MKTETLESLLLDRALGELSPEIGELLDAYLAQAPVDAARASRWSLVARLARAAEAIDDPAQPLPRWHAPRHRPRWMAPRELLRLAACLALGGFAGWSMGAGGWQAGLRTRSKTSTPVANIAKATGPRETVRREAAEFWSIAAFARAGASGPAVDRASYRLQWDSPAKLPHLEEKP